MPASGGSVSDAPVNKVVDGQSHYLAYITPDEGKSLTDQGGKETITNSGIPAYPTHHGSFGTSMGVQQGGNNQGNQGYQTVHDTGAVSQTPGRTVSTDTVGNGGYQTVHDTGAITQTPGRITETQEQKEDNLIEQFKSGVIDKATVIKNALKLGLTNSKKLMDATGITTAFSLAMSLGGNAQKKAMTWSLENRLKSIQKQKDFHPGAYGYKISDIQSDIEGVKEGTFSQNDFTRKYGSGDASNPLDASFDPSTARDGDNARGLTNIITPYAAHAIGGTTQQPSMAAQWYANLGSGNTNPGAFNLTQQYAAAKASVSQRLKSTSSIGQIAVADSAFFNFLKDNSLNKGIL